MIHSSTTTPGLERDALLQHEFWPLAVADEGCLRFCSRTQNVRSELCNFGRPDGGDDLSSAIEWGWLATLISSQCRAPRT